MGSVLTALDFCADLKIRSEKMDEGLKGIVHPKINILSSFTHVVPNQHYVLFFFPLGNTKRDVYAFQSNESKLGFKTAKKATKNNVMVDYMAFVLYSKSFNFKNIFLGFY